MVSLVGRLFADARHLTARRASPPSSSLNRMKREAQKRWSS
jgi:hypothetical protein